MNAAADHERVFRIGGGSVDNLRLKPKEWTLKPPGISVFIHVSALAVVEQLEQAFPNATRLLADAIVVGTALVSDIRSVGFDVLYDPTKRFPNHARLIRADHGTAREEWELAALSQVFTDLPTRK